MVSQGVVGRFAERHVFYPYFDVFADGQTVPVYGKTMYVVLVPNLGHRAGVGAGDRGRHRDDAAPARSPAERS